ncbi:phage minor structural, N-terminal region domain protein [Streptococcus oralis]|uniref:tail fiber domain-containing protein n=1 Tax=Streptococcus phage SM1 TaxID=157924 RepID=UPI000009B195|nr:phage tail spike protein [Streptococcus oralis]NP_862890.1 tail fiber domain-containing protein [Streptococcus phage SM1]AAG18640.1 PblB [Streptococcus phage SM1]QQL00447.1 phage tail protein [Streptococcus oralis]QRO08225.1 phage minor structural, N-terminal region domain protein [Streptococcus oralis]
MIYLTNGNTPLNAAYADKISQEANSTYQLTFRFPTSDVLWEKLKEETFLKADDLHGEQDFVIFEVQKKHGYIQVYANQVMTLLNNYVINPISLDRATGSTALSRFAGSITRYNTFSFFSDIDERHTFNTDSVNAMVAFTKDKHSILGQWGGDLVRHGYQVRLLKNGGSENESLFMYKKNLSSYQHKTSTKSLKTRITFKATVKGEGEKAPDRKFSVVVDSPLVNKYSQIYEDVIEVNDQDVKDEVGLRKYGEQYFRTTLCDMLEDSLEIQVEGKSDVPVQIFDIVSLFHDRFKMDVRKKITKYTYSPMAKKLLSIGFGQFKSGLSNMLSNAVSDAVKNETQHLQGQFATQLGKEIKNADLAFDRKKEELVNQFTDGLNAAKAKAEEVKKSLTETIDQRFRDFDSTGLNEIKQKAEEALQRVGANTLLAQEAKQISEQARQQMDSKFAEYKQSVDGRFTSLSSQLAGKANLIDFQRVQEKSNLYERIIGSSESDIAEKVARMTLTNQLFQVEVGKYSAVGGPNVLRNSRADDGLKYWSEANGRLNFTAHSFYFNGQKRMFELRPGAIVKSPRFIIKRNTDYTLNILGFDNNSKFFRVYVSKRVKGSVADFQQRLLIFNGQPKWVDGPVFDNTKTVKKSITFNVGEFDECYLQFEYDRNNPNKWGGLFMTELDFYEGTTDRRWQPAPEDATLETDKTLEATQTKLTLLQGSFAIQNLTSAGSIVSQINATNNQILIEAEKIRLKGKTLLDELTAIDGYFKRLFVGEGTFAKLNAEIIGSKTITADKLIMDQAMARLFVSSDIFTDTLAAKEAFINKLRSVVVSATLFEGFKGRIGGFQIGTHDKDPSTYWLTGTNQFAVGMSNGSTKWGQTALWVNWGGDWNKPGDKAWFVKSTGEMHCYNTAHFWNNPKIHGDLEVTGDIVYRYENNGAIYLKGYWIYSPQYKRMEESNNYLYLYRDGSSYSWIPMNKEISDRRYKSNIKDSQVSGLDIIEQLKTYSYRKEYDGKIEDISCGIMAQDVQKYVPEAFFENPDGAYSYRTFELVPYLIKAIQELNQKIQKLEKTA